MAAISSLPKLSSDLRTIAAQLGSGHILPKAALEQVEVIRSLALDAFRGMNLRNQEPEELRRAYLAAAAALNDKGFQCQPLQDQKFDEVYLAKTLEMAENEIAKEVLSPDFIDSCYGDCGAKVLQIPTWLPGNREVALAGTGDVESVCLNHQTDTYELYGIFSDSSVKKQFPDLFKLFWGKSEKPMLALKTALDHSHLSPGGGMEKPSTVVCLFVKDQIWTITAGGGRALLGRGEKGIALSVNGRISRVDVEAKDRLLIGSPSLWSKVKGAEAISLLPKEYLNQTLAVRIVQGGANRSDRSDGPGASMEVMVIDLTENA